MTKKRNDLTKTEWSLMNICWKKGKVSAREIYEVTLKEKQRGYQTVKTMLDRMVGKEFLEREKFGPIWLYKPVVSKTKMLGREIESFVNTVLDKTLAPLFVHLAEKENLTEEEIDSLKKLIEEYEESEGGE